MDPISLAGIWLFSLGTPDPGLGAQAQAALPAITYSEYIELPGTTETRGKGPLNAARETHMLTRVRKFDGPAWYARDITIPADWAGKRIELSLERTRYSQVWLDEHPMGTNALLGSPQTYDLTAHATPGKHRLTILVDNRPERRPVQSEAHQWSDNTQTNWNGIIGKLELRAKNPVSLGRVEVYPERGNVFALVVLYDAADGRTFSGTLSVSARSWNHAGAVHVLDPVSISVSGDARSAERIDLPLGRDVRRWDEFSPALYRLAVTLETDGGRDERIIETGYRCFSTDGTQFTINGRPTFLRGKQEACVFPFTGHPPMDVEGWLKYLGTLRDYGINHLRCHTWIPPEAAFAAADRLGMYWQPELPFWGGMTAEVATALRPEWLAAFAAYGNHPSFVMFTLGNELSAGREEIAKVLTEMAAHQRALVAGGSNNFLWDPVLQPEDQFWPTVKTRTPAGRDKIHVVRGSFFNGDGYDGHVQWGAPETRTDLRAAVEGLPIPVIGHETGQYTFYPDFREITKYTGVTRARNFEIFRESLARSGQLEQAHLFFQASGALATELYREEIELALRTPGLGGFQLLDLQDFPGQGTALVGILDPFLDSKGFVSPQRWREFCSAIVPLARFDRYTWTTADTFTADLDLAHYGATDWRDARVTWRLTDAEEAPIVSGSLPPVDVAQGNVRSLGRITASLADVVAPVRANLEVTVSSGVQRVQNRWPLWIYAAETANEETSTSFVVVRSFDADAKARLAAGERVVLMPKRGRDWARTVRGAYATDFWCWPMFNNNPGTMGLLCNPEHPALARFPTAFHSERQWTRIADTSTPVLLDGAPAGLRPIVQVIDNLARNERIGLVFEAKVGRGSLLVIACDLLALDEFPEARQLYASLKHYASSAAFRPEVELSPEFLDTILRPSLATGATINASSHFQPPWGRVPEPKLIIDGDINSSWRAADNDATPTISLDLGSPRAIDTLEFVWNTDEAGYKYLVEGSSDGGTTWMTLSDQRRNTVAQGRHVISVATTARHLRVTITSHPPAAPASLREWYVLGR